MTFPITPRLFVEASAGTGKTYVIEHHLVRMILEERIEPVSCALITFTRAVARELRVRVKKTVEMALAYFSGEPVQGAIPEYFSLFPDKKKAAQALSLFLDDFTAVSITTIHGFCEKLLSLWYEGDGAWERSKKAWLQEFLLAQTFISAEEWSLVGKDHGYDHAGFLEKLLKLMDDPAIESEPSKSERIRSLQETLAAGDFSACDFFSTYAKQFRGNCTREGELHEEKKIFFDRLLALLKNPSEKNIDALVATRIDGNGLFKTPLKKSLPLGEPEAAQFLLLTEKVFPHLSSLMSPEDVCRRIAVQAAKAFFSYAAKEKKKTFETVLRDVLSLSREEAFVQAIPAKFSCIIIDEFQDTDTSQLEIFKNLFLDCSWKGNILFVGDPKQAIYAFRKADVYSYMHARDMLSEHVRTLSVNFRATKNMVSAINALFAGEEQKQVFYLPKDGRSLEVAQNLSAGLHEELEDKGRGALHFMCASDSLGRKKNWPHENIEKAVLAWMCDEIISLEPQVLFKNQAILVRDRYQGKRVEEFLAERNIPTCSWRLDCIDTSPMYELLQKILLLVAQPHNKKRLLSLLFALNDKETCKAIVADRNLSRHAVCVQEWQKVKTAFSFKGIGALARELLSCRYNGVEVFADFLSKQKKELSFDLEQLFEILSSYENRLSNSIDAYKHTLDEMKELSAEEKEVRRIDPDDIGVPILTMHRSKGLEFDVVYALGTASRTQVCEGDYEEANAEKLRQMYVSMTRAKRRVYVPCFLQEDGKEVPLDQASPVELLLKCFQKGDAIDHEHHKKIVQDWARSYEGIITFSDVTQEKRNLCAQKREIKDDVEEFGPIIGEGYAYTSFSRQKRREGLVVRPRHKGTTLFGIQFHGEIAALLQGESREEPDEKLSAFLSHALNVQLPYNQENILLHELKKENIRCEVPFLYEEENGFVTGVIDVLFLHDGKLFLLDWKTQSVDVPLDIYVKQEQYDLQCAIYKKAAQKAFPQIPWGGFFFVFVQKLTQNEPGVLFYGN